MDNPVHQTASRKNRPVRSGEVFSCKADKTIGVVMEFVVKHPKYGKYIRRRSKVLAHDADNAAKVGDKVEIMECRPISKQKRWRLIRILEKSHALEG